MARKELIFTAEDGRDAGKLFALREMPAAQAERWALRAFLAIGKAGIELPAGTEELGMVGLARIGLTRLMHIAWEDAEPLLDEMMACVQRKETAVVRPLTDDDIEEVATRLKLRRAVFELHTDFFGSAGPSTSESGRQTPGQAAFSTIAMPRPR